ncbi:MAG: curli-like amyloid fiber formation chaperone CsgH [Pseudomonas sp.]
MMDFSQLAVSIDTQRNGGVVMVRPHIENPTPLTLQYRMTVRQNSAGGTSSINQQGDIQSGVMSSSVTLSMPAGATCQVHLEVFEQDVLVKAVDGSCDGVVGG